MSSFHKWRSEVNFEQVPSSLVIEIYLHLIIYSIKDYVPGKPALKKKQQGSKYFGIATHVKVGDIFIFMSYGDVGVRWFPSADLCNHFFWLGHHARHCKPGVSILTIIH